MQDPAHQLTIGILYPGEMGSSLGKLLAEGGFKVLATTEGRSPRTQRLGLESRLPLAASAGEVAEQADVIVSLVTPGAALDVATKIAALLTGRSRKPLYVDANSISPETAAQIENVLSRESIEFVDASIFGLASQLRQRGTLYVSGSRAGELRDQWGALLPVKVVGDSPGRASAFKMIISGIPKGLSALFIETMVFARKMQLLPEALEACEEIYPGIMEIMRRMLPTYPKHATRRCEEAGEIEKTMLANQCTPHVTSAVRELTCRLADVSWEERDGSPWSMEEVLEAIHKHTLQHTPGNYAKAAGGGGNQAGGTAQR